MEQEQAPRKVRGAKLKRKGERSCAKGIKSRLRQRIIAVSDWNLPPCITCDGMGIEQR